MMVEFVLCSTLCCESLPSVSEALHPVFFLTLFRLGFFGQSVTGGGGVGGLLGPSSVSLEPIMLGS